jgi:hypothetical protein
MPGASYKMLLQWAQQVVRGVCPARLFRYASNENAQFMNRLWNYIKSVAHLFHTKALVAWRLGLGRSGRFC